MTKYMKDIEKYGDIINDFVISPFETHYMFFVRSILHQKYDELSYEEKESLSKYDDILKKNAKEMYKHLGQIYDFSNSKEPEEEWWWHLDRLVNKT